MALLRRYFSCNEIREVNNGLVTFVLVVGFVHVFKMFLDFCVFWTILNVLDAHFAHHNHYGHARFHGNHFHPGHRHTFYSAGQFQHPLNHFHTGYHETPKMNIRHFSGEHSHESLSTYQCDFMPEDFMEEPPVRHTVVCTWGNEFVLRRHNRRQFWCIGYLPSSDSPNLRKRRKRPVLRLTFDRAFRMGYVRKS